MRRPLPSPRPQVRARAPSGSRSSVRSRVPIQGTSTKRRRLPRVCRLYRELNHGGQLALLEMDRDNTRGSLLGYLEVRVEISAQLGRLNNPSTVAH
jgi:hypothetical protein